MPASIINKTAPIFIIEGTKKVEYRLLLDTLLKKGLLAGSAPEEIVENTYPPLEAIVLVHIHENRPNPALFTYDPSDVDQSRKFLSLNISADGASSETDEVYGNALNVDSYNIASTKYIVIASLIANYFKISVPKELYRIPKPKHDYSETLSDLLSRLDEAIEGIAAMRINSAAATLDEMRYVSRSIRVKYSERETGKIVTAHELKDTISTILTHLAKLYDIIENSKLAAIVVSGATTTLIGATGLSSTLNLSIMLAAWYGKDSFLKAIETVSVNKSRASRTRKAKD